MRDGLGDDLAIFGFTHAAGQFTAVPGPGTHTLGAPAPLSYEWHLDAASAPRFMLDLRGLDTSAPGAEWLATNRQTRFIGCCYDPSRPASFWWTIDLRSAFDVIIHYASTGPTTVLPFQYPERVLIGAEAGARPRRTSPIPVLAQTLAMRTV